MEQAWLDSLSEDWPSDPRSTGSPPPSLPSMSNSVSSQRISSTRIPKFNPQKQAWTTLQEENSALGERSPNEHNLPLSQRSARQPSKLGEVKNGTQGRRVSRANSSSTTVSTKCNTVQHKSHSVSPKRSAHETPEWKRRLLQGEVAYGEQRDLFSPAGLENIFRPPPSQTPSPIKLPSQKPRESSIVMPSSPPPYISRRTTYETIEPIDGNSSVPMDNERKDSHAPKGVRYKLTEPAGSDFTANDFSRSSTFHPVPPTAYRDPSGAPSLPESSILQIDPAPGRTASGQSDIRNEELSPIIMSKQLVSDRHIDSAIAGPIAKELQRRLEDIRESSPVQSIEDEVEASVLLPQDMTQETDDYAHNGNFINLRRGGYSHEGSFRQRMLSPSSLPAIDESAMLLGESMQASTPKQLPKIRKTRISNEAEVPSEESRSDPQTPTTSPKKPSKEHKSNSGSPLKIFGTYDTFTNQKLLRRLSQFEGNVDENANERSAASGAESTNTELNYGFVATSSPQRQQQRTNHLPSKNFQNFGEGELDSFRFSESYNSSQVDAVQKDNEELTLPTLNPREQSSFKFQLEPSPALQDNVVVRRRTEYTSMTKQTYNVRQGSRPQTRTSSNSYPTPSQGQEDLRTPRKRNGNSEGKRLLKTPVRNPTPKRRRTLHEYDVEFEENKHEIFEPDSLRETHQHMQSVIGRKRKDARNGDDQQAANPTVLAMRQMLRPRTPTPSQRSSQLSDGAHTSELDPEPQDQVRMLQQKKIAKIQAELDSTDPLRVSALLSTSQQMQNESRKGSVTTQDFLDEAKKIMAGIRGKARPHSGLASLEESESENDKNQSLEMESPGAEGYDSYEESTIEPFSRPPSREGAPLIRLPLKQEDPALLDHLRKYQEMSDADAVVASSIRSMVMAKEALLAAKELDRSIEETIFKKTAQPVSAIVIISDPPNTRISSNPDLLRKRKPSASSTPADGDGVEGEFPTQTSQSSGGQSTIQSIPTGSSRGSDSRRVIAPHAVSHLIPEQLAGMVFDREGNKWVKRKSSTDGQNFLPSDDTEDDPFGDIPDLSVDETQEMQRIKAVAAKLKEQDQVAQREIDHAYAKNEANLVIVVEPISPEQSRITQTTQSCTPPELTTQSSTWENVAASSTKKDTHVEEVIQATVTHLNRTREVVEEVEREISIHEDRVLETPQRKRKVTITFSSPLESIVKPSEYNFDASFQSEGQYDGDSDDECIEKEIKGSGLKNSLNSAANNSTRIRSALRNSSRRVSVAGHTFSVRPVSRIDERDEESSHQQVEDETMRSVSILVTTPAPQRRASSLMLATPRPTHEIGTLTLTPMSDFTMHQRDETPGLDVSYVAHNQRYVHGSGDKKTLSLSIKNLVEKITEVEPYEPFWENMKELTLKNKNLSNLHKLEEFCADVEDLDVSHNQLTQLDGVPQAVRQLRITHNILSDLTAWGHLQNLQYIDVSNNELESLSAFKSLIHMRSLRADNNKIRSLKGVDHLDGLLSLRLRGNSIQALDFSGTSLLRLTDLDLKDNHISSVDNLEELRSLSGLNLVDNHLCEFTVRDAEPLWSLKYLKLSGNNLESIDVSKFPNIRLLYLDQNRLGKITGLLKTKHLDSLSLREQHEESKLDPSFISEAYEVRKLFLSGNFLGSFQPTTDFLNLQYLELANCGLESLPEGFGYLIANTRVLNLNYNALSDLSPLSGIVRLKKLHVAGNRLRFLKETAHALSCLPTVALADLRGNPLTVGFYPPTMEMAMVLHDETDAEPRMTEPYTLVEADPAKVAKYATCLDMQTKMLKRTYEMLAMTTCRRLMVLDGMAVDRGAIKKRDRVWEELVRIGVFNARAFCRDEGREGEGGSGGEEDKDGDVREEEGKGNTAVGEKPEEEERWYAEDSFA